MVRCTQLLMSSLLSLVSPTLFPLSVERKKGEGGGGQQLTCIKSHSHITWFENVVSHPPVYPLWPSGHIRSHQTHQSQPKTQTNMKCETISWTTGLIRNVHCCVLPCGPGPTSGRLQNTQPELETSAKRHLSN